MRKKIKHPFKNAVRLLFPLGFVLCFSTSAAVIDDYTQRGEQREWFLEAEQRIERRDFDRARELMLKLADYPLFPYLEAAFLEQNFSLANEPFVLEFLEEYQGTPAERQLRTAWLNFLARRNDGARFLRDYRRQGSAHLQCYYLRERYRSLRRADPSESIDAEFTELWNDVTEQWMHGRSLPSACDPVFLAWSNAGHRTDDVVWQRIKLALDARQTGLARYLARFMDDDTRYLADLMRRVNTSPSVVRRFQEFPGADPREREIILYGLGRLRWNNHDALVSVWEHFKDKYPFSEQERAQMESDIAVTLALRGDDRALGYFQRLDPAYMTDTARQWYLTARLATQNYGAIAAFIDRLPEDIAERGQWLYWSARAQAELGNFDDAMETMERTAQQRNYYGFLASARLSLIPELSHDEPEFSPDALEQLAQSPAAQRAYELRQMERFLDARREWNLVRQDLGEDEQVLAAILASEWGWHDQAIFGFAQSGSLNDVHRRFPLGYSELLQEQAAQASIDPAWVFAITRRESSFQPDAVSPAGARGLMQVMPATADYLLRNSPGPTSRIPTQTRLFNPEENVRLGTQYLADLLRRTDNNWLLATAAYNAGIYRMQEWLPSESVPADLWIEMIPFQETRDYVKAVLAYQQIYTMLLGKDANVLAPLIRMQINGTNRG